MRQTQATLAHPLEPFPDLSKFDLVVLGQAAIENFARMRGERFVPRRARPLLWFRHANLRALRRSRTPKAIFTKNDYKHFENKNGFIAFVQPKLVITQHRSALEHLRNPSGKLIWLPFGVDAETFTPPDPDGPRPFAMGFRANANSEWNGGERERFFRALGRLETKHQVSLTMSKEGEGFLIGKPYVDWMRSCALLGNTVSAAGTVGPRFLEAMACGTTVLAPRNAYEGLLVPDQHYIPVDPGPDGSFPDLEAAVARFFAEPAYREQLRQYARSLVETHTVDQHVLHVLREVGV
jgi:glycosyltransferase involved in cell wall biosynthesis